MAFYFKNLLAGWHPIFQDLESPWKQNMSLKVVEFAVQYTRDSFYLLICGLLIYSYLFMVFSCKHSLMVECCWNRSGKGAWMSLKSPWVFTPKLWPPCVLADWPRQTAEGSSCQWRQFIPVGHVTMTWCFTDQSHHWTLPSGPELYRTVQSLVSIYFLHVTSIV